MQEVVQGTVSSFGTELSPGLEFVKGNWHLDLEFFCERGRSVFDLLPLECDLDGLNDFDFRRDAFLRS
ncbi:unnamed protein product [Rhizophagus irregularis]|nr:unnamed protein product [Rhizophagus irregularis]